MAEKFEFRISVDVSWWGSREDLEDSILPSISEALSRTTDGVTYDETREIN